MAQTRVAAMTPLTVTPADLALLEQHERDRWRPQVHAALDVAHAQHVRIQQLEALCAALREELRLCRSSNMSK